MTDITFEPRALRGQPMGRADACASICGSAGSLGYADAWMHDAGVTPIDGVRTRVLAKVAFGVRTSGPPG